ncbi:MAG: hypothetical protein ACHQ1H_14700 [Nitrososphaerales archaeon]
MRVQDDNCFLFRKANAPRAPMGASTAKIIPIGNSGAGIPDVVGVWQTTLTNTSSLILPGLLTMPVHLSGGLLVGLSALVGIDPKIFSFPFPTAALTPPPVA